MKTKTAEISSKNLPESLLHQLLAFYETHEGFEGAKASLVKTLNTSSLNLVQSPLLEDAQPIVNSRRRFEDRTENILVAQLISSCQLAALIQDIGVAALSSKAAFTEILSEFPTIQEVDVAQVLGVIAKTGAQPDADSVLQVFQGTHRDPPQGQQGWNTAVFVDVLKTMVESPSYTQYPKLNWIAVIENLDHPGFSVSDAKGFNALLATFRKATNEAFPLSLLYDRLWHNRAGQLSMIKFALATPDLHLDNACKKQPPLEIHSVKTSLLQSHWYSTGLVETLLQLSESESHQVIRTLFEQPLKNQPELLVLGLAQAKVTWGSSTLHSELSTLLLAIFLGNHPNSSFVLHKLWVLNPGMVVRGIVEMYFKDASVLPKILSLAQDFKGLARVLEARPFSFAIDLAALAAHRDFLNLEIWLQDRIDEHGAPFVRSMVTYLKKDTAYRSKSEPQRSFTLSQVAIETFYGILRNNLLLIPPENLEELKKLNNNPALFAPQEEEPVTTGEHPGFPAAVEEGANSYFQKIYTGQMSIDELISLLKNFKSSTDSRESDIFACMIHNLFDEYRFFPKYPDKELSITAVLFGALIQNQLVSFLPLGVALRHVLDALRKPPSSKMFKFGLIALDQFKSRLYEWPQYCSHILQIAHIRQFHPEIVQFIEAGLEAPVGLPDPFHAGPPGLGAPEVDLPPGLAPDMPQPAHTPPVTAEKKSPTPPPARPPAAKLPPATGKLALPIDTLTTTDVSFAQPSIQIQDRVAFIVNNISPANLVDKVRELLATLTATETPYFAHYVVTKRVSIEPNFHALYLSMCEKVSVKLRQLFPRLVDFTVEGIKNLLASDKVKRDISERTLLKNLGTWLGIITLGKDKPILWNQLGLKDLLLQGFDDDNLVAVVPLVAKIMDATGHSRVFRLPNPWTMSILRLLVEIYRIPDLKLNLKFEVEVLCNSLGVELNTIPPSSLLENRQKPSEEVSLANLARHVRINPQITLFQIQPTLKKYVPVAVERAVQDIMHPVVERSVTIACVTTRELVLKDFALDSDTKKLQRAAQVMVQNLASSLALVTCKEPLRASIAAVLWPAFQPHSTDTVLIEQAITMICNDNIELATSMIERAATKKAQHDIEEALLPAVQLRTQWTERRPMNGHFMDPQHVQPPRPPTLPDFLAPRQTGVSQLQLKVYEAFGEPARVHETGEIPPQDHVDFAAKVSSFFPTLDQLIQTKVAGTDLATNSELSDLFQALVDSTGRNPALVMLAARLILEHMQQLFSNLPLELYSQLLGKLDAVARIAGALTALLLQDPQNQFPELTTSLIKHRLVDLGAIDSTIAQWISVNSNTVKLATYVIQTCLIDEAVLTANDLPQTLSMLEKLVAQKIKGSEQLDQLVRFARGARSARKETPELESRQPVQKILNEWLQIASQPSYTDKGYVQFVARLQQQDLLKADSNTQKFLRICTEVCLEATVAKPEGSALNYTAIDALSKLIVFLVKHHPDQADMSRIAFLSLFLEVAVQHLIRDFELTTSNFNQRPYFRLLSNLLIELNQPDPALEALHFPILVTFSNVFIALQPSRIPAFSFAWLELISHRMFMPKLLLSKPPKGWPYFQRVLIELFKFLEPYLRNVELNDPIRLLYKGTIRVLLVLLHDFPEFLCEFHFTFCDVIPPTCIQMRNLILSAFPRNMRLPDPFTPNLKVDLLPEINQPPRILSSYVTFLAQTGLKQDIDDFIQSHSPALLETIKTKLSGSDGSNPVPLLNALVLYAGVQAIQHNQANPSAPITHNASMDLFQYLAHDFNSELRYLFFNALANQLRYPNNHTHYFSCVLLFLFAEANNDLVKEQITRVLLERLIVNRPHPWGLLITFIELIKNPRYKFWNHGFTRCAPEIERVFEYVARSCLGRQPGPLPKDEKL